MTQKISLLLLSLFLTASLSAQQNLSWRKHRKLAEQLYQEGRYFEAGENYEQAWNKKQRKEELIFMAGECFYTIKDYRRAAEAYQYVKDENEEYPLVGLKYARSLKQDGQYAKAQEEFRTFLDQYTGDGRAILEDIIQTEIQGCELGIEAPSRADRSLNVTRPGSGVNSLESDEFAPFPATSGALYYSSDQGGTVRIYRSQRQGRNWTKGSIPENFPLIQGQHFGNGAFSPSGERFYFTICEGNSAWNDLTTRCEIFTIRRETNGWSAPERLPDYINMEGVTATQPSVVHQGGLEILYFASNREGGRGGMDLWYATRDLGADNVDFTFPVNLGPTINTYGDEMTPFYDIEEGMLYFASNGHISIGGFDIFTSRGEETNWTYPANAGIPINSPAEDMSYVKNPYGAFLASNRIFAPEKITTHDRDILQLGGSSAPVSASIEGMVYDQQTGRPLSAGLITLFQVTGAEADRYVDQRSLTNGAYQFNIQPGSRYRIEIQSTGYLPDAYEVVADAADRTTFGQNVYLNPVRTSPPPTTDPAPTTDPRPTRPDPVVSRELIVENPANPGAPYTTRGRTEGDKQEYITTAPRYRGEYFKIQLIALGKFDPNNAAFNPIRDMGRLDTEYLVGRNLTRVMLADFFTRSEAFSALDKVRRNGFPNAYIVRYEDGERYGRERK